MILQDITDGIVAALLYSFSNCRVYTEEIKQGLTTPCFIVQLVSPMSDQFLGNRYFRTNLFSIQYLPANSMAERAECIGITDKLFAVLEYITASGDLLRGTDMRSEFFDGVMTFFVNYNLFVSKNVDFETMEEIQTEIEV